MKMVKIFLDDALTPEGEGWLQVRKFSDFVEIVRTSKPITHISLDSDLGETHVGECRYGDGVVKWLIEECIDNPDVCANLEEITTHSYDGEEARQVIQLLKVGKNCGIFPRRTKID